MAMQPPQNAEWTGVGGTLECYVSSRVLEEPSQVLITCDAFGGYYYVFHSSCDNMLY
jgi:hypothetical protein